MSWRYYAEKLRGLTGAYWEMWYDIAWRVREQAKRRRRGR